MQAMHCPWQHLVEGKDITPLEAHMDDELIAFAVRQKLERVASYRQLQGYSHQLRSMTLYRQRPVTLKTFAMPAGFCVRPVNSNEKRMTLRGRDRDIGYIENTETKVRTAILPDAAIQVPVLILGLDQGSVGCAGCAFMQFHLHCMVYSKYDKIHRLIRDVKNAENGCCRKIFTKTKLWSAYLYALRKRPFGSGSNFTAMERMMELFELQCDIYSPVFLKYLPKLGRAWNMPFGTVNDKQAIFNRVLETQSFRQHGSQPKLSNWFSWNQAAKSNMPDFFAIKLVDTAIHGRLYSDRFGIGVSYYPARLLKPGPSFHRFDMT